MQISLKSLLTISLFALITMSLQGCVQGGFSQKGYSKGNDCRFCHVPNAGKGIRDFSIIFDNPKIHHPVGVMYPLGSDSSDDFNQPNGLTDDGTIFFDDDGVGELDINDVRLFGTGDAVTVECASCHREHGDAPASGEDIANHFLRITNENSRLCITCHRE